MPAVSKAQQAFMAICEHEPGKAKSKCPSPKVAREYASTPTNDLPRRVNHPMAGKDWDR